MSPAQPLPNAERTTSPLILGSVVGVLALAILLLGLDGAGYWSDAELPVLNRARAALGAALSGLEHSPAVPDWFRTRSFALRSDEWGLRLPHAVAVAALAGIAAGWCRARGAPAMVAAVAGFIALSFPILGLTGRTALGNPIGELVGVLFVLASIGALRSSLPKSSRMVLSALALGLLAASIASSGLVMGGAAPLVAVAFFAPSSENRPRLLLPALALACVALVGTAVWLVIHQQDGYIPILGAAKDIELLDKPAARRFADVLSDFGYQVFPWAGLVAFGATRPTSRWPAIWCLAVLSIGGGWSLLFGPTPLPVAVPAALCCAAAIESFTDSNASGVRRRVAIFIVVAAAFVMRKDASLHPSRLAAPTIDFGGEQNFPADSTQAEARLSDMAKAVLVAMILAGLLGRRRESGRLERLAAKLPGPLRDRIVVGGFGLAALAGVHAHGHRLVTDLGVASSVRRPLTRHGAWASEGELPSALAVHRVRDPGLEIYATDHLETLASRREVSALLSADDPAVALIRKQDLPTVHQHARANDWPLYVLDDTHARLRLLSNRLPADAEDLNPIPAVVSDTPVQLANETLVRFDNFIEIIGWEVDGPIRRGGHYTLRLAIKVIQPLPSGSKIYTRFLKGRLGRINGDPHEITSRVYPCNLWRKGDYILDEFEFDAPPLEIPWGEYDLVIGLRRSERKNYGISLPDGKHGEFGVEIRGKSREFAAIGKVQVW